MEGSYGVYFGSQLAGKIQVSRKGLYYHFSCRCQLSGAVVCRLRVICDGKEHNLGILVPIEDGFGLEKMVSIKKFGKGLPEFNIIPKTTEAEGNFVPIYPDEPFAYIDKLKSCFLIRKYGQAGVLIK